MAKTASERKKNYDETMRNRGRLLRPDDVERYPTTLYLADEAKKVLREQRQLDRHVGASPCTDSLFVEAAILAMEGKAPVASNSKTERMVKAARKRALTETRRRNRLESQLLELRIQVGYLERKLERAQDDEAIPFDRDFLRLHAAIRKEVLGAMTQLEEAKAIHRLLCEYVVSLR